jgi:hypothetical protein
MTAPSEESDGAPAPALDLEFVPQDQEGGSARERSCSKRKEYEVATSTVAGWLGGWVAGWLVGWLAG